jgi:hypothetical protein
VGGQAFPDDGGIPEHCADVPSGCQVFDCTYDMAPVCPACLSELCPSCERGAVCTIVHGRSLTCL